MNTTVAAPERQQREPAATRPQAPRLDLYRGIHKALRACMAETTTRIGCLDVTDRADLEDGLARLDELLDFCAGHVQHENEFVHTAIEARQPGGSGRVANEHDEHVDSIAALRQEASALRTARAGDAAELAHRLYRHLALFVAENLQHMQIEETLHNAILWSCYGDDELLEIHGRLMASLSPQTHLLALRWMLPAAHPGERAMLIGAAKAQMPPEALLSVLAAVRPRVDAGGWTKLCTAAGVDPSFCA